MSIAEITDEDYTLYAPKLLLTRHTGAILWWFQEIYSYGGTPNKLKPAVVSITVKNLIFGWWSPMSLVINPVVTLVNWIYFNQYKKTFARFLSNPEAYIIKAKDTARIATEKAERAQKRGLVVLGVLGAILAVSIVIAVVGSK